MDNLETLKDGLLEQLKDLYSAENQLLKALPKMEKKAVNDQLKQAIRAHLQETEGHVERLDQIGEILQQKLSGKTCKAMQGLIEEGKEAMEQESDNEALLDLLLVEAARRVEHYEMAGYSGVCMMAKEVGEEEVVRLLEETLREESAAERKLSSIAGSSLLAEANSGGEMEDGENGSKKMKKASDQGKKRSENMQKDRVGHSTSRP